MYDFPKHLFIKNDANEDKCVYSWYCIPIKHKVCFKVVDFILYVWKIETT